VYPTKKQWKDWSLPSKLTAIGAYLTIIAFPLAWLSAVTIFVPRVNISPTQTFDPPTPFSVRFEVQNGGFFDVHDVHLTARVNGRVGGIVVGKGQEKDTNLAAFMQRHPEKYGPVLGLLPEMEPSFISKIGPGHKPASWMNITLLKVKTREGDVLDAVVSASFRPSFAWWHRTTTQRFISIRSQDGSFGWVEAPLK
jgi:hypothetical protein